MIPGDQNRDASYRTDIAHDRMSAMLTVIPPYGSGAAPDAIEAEAALRKAGVVFGIDAAAISEAVAAPGNPVVVARGELAKPPVHAWIEPLVDLDHAHRPHEDEKGRADFRELGILRFVASGTPLMRRHPPQDGIPGHTVQGTELAALKAKDARFSVRLQGVAPAPRDPDLLLAAIDGQPVQRPDGIGVEPVLVVDTVNISTGNIDFPGTVEVKGDVETGMKVKAGGDIVIQGTVESAELEAKGEIQVKGGVIGLHGDMQAGEGDAKSSGARIRAKSVRAHHIDNATIVAGKSVFVDDSIRHSDVTATDQVIVGKEGTRRGHIIGGNVRATHGVVAYCLGSLGTSKTRITVGVNAELDAALEEKRAEAAVKIKEQEDLDKVIRVLQAKPGREDMLAKAKLTRDKRQEELAGIEAAQKEIEAQLELAASAEVVVKAEVYPGTMVTIGRRHTLVPDSLGPGLFRLEMQEIAGREDLEVVFKC